VAHQARHPSQWEKIDYGPLVKRLRHRPLTPVTRVRFPHGSPVFSEEGELGRKESHDKGYRVRYTGLVINTAGADDAEVPPVPIPNTEVKLSRAEDTWRETAWENG
jgi:hypothetical protein